MAEYKSKFTGAQIDEALTKATNSRSVHYTTGNLSDVLGGHTAVWTTSVVKPDDVKVGDIMLGVNGYWGEVTGKSTASQGTYFSTLTKGGMQTPSNSVYMHNITCYFRNSDQTNFGQMSMQMVSSSANEIASKYSKENIIELLTNIGCDCWERAYSCTGEVYIEEYDRLYFILGAYAEYDEMDDTTWITVRTTDNVYFSIHDLYHEIDGMSLYDVTDIVTAM